MGRLRPRTGETIDGFLLGERIHGGAMASIWVVTRPGQAFPMVMKVPLLAEGEDVSAIVGFEVEQMILPRLTGPHVPRFVALGDFSKLPYLVMERVLGQNLADIAERAPLPPNEVVEIGARVARALQDLHRQHVLHLDLKPANIMLRFDPDAAVPREGQGAVPVTGEAVFLDFGLSRHDELPDLLGEEADVPMGTGAYMAPEQVFGDRSDPRSDIFALGVVLYQLATGRLPFGTPQRKAGIRRRLWRDPEPPLAKNAAFPPWLQEIILKCLEVNPDRRFATPAQLAFALTHSDQVTLTPRAGRVARDSAWTVFWRWLKARRAAPVPRPAIAERLAAAPIILAAVDLAGGMDGLAEAVRDHVGRALATLPGGRLACVSVLKTALLALDSTIDAEGNHLYVQRLVALKDWARPLRLADERVSFHVLEAVDPAAAILDYARHNQVDHIVLGARASSTLRRYLGSVSSQVVAQAPCTVTVVRRGRETTTSEEAD